MMKQALILIKGFTYAKEIEGMVKHISTWVHASRLGKGACEAHN